MKPEEKARVKIDQWLTETGWKVIDRDEFEADSSAVAWIKQAGDSDDLSLAELWLTLKTRAKL